MDELYVVARSVLLDALDALGEHRDAAILVGAHAVYMRVGEADLAIAPYTTDGDLVLNPAKLASLPPLEQALTNAGFEPDSVGTWITHRATTNNPRTEVAIDFLVPRSVSPGQGRRAARLLGHDASVARIVRGLDGVLADADPMPIRALAPSDERVFDLHVAGPGALLVAKLHKIKDRSGTSRSADKDALDVLRLLRGTSTRELAERMNRVIADAAACAVAVEALDLLRRLFAERNGNGVEMAVRAVGALDDVDEIEASCEALSRDLLNELGR